MSRELTPQEEVVERALHWVAVGLLGLNLPLSTLRAVRNPGAYRTGVAATVLVALWVLLVAAAVRCARRRSAAAPLRAALGVSVAALVVAHPWLLGPRPVPYPPLFHVLGAALCVSAVGGVRFSALLVPPFSLYVAAVRSTWLGWGRALAEACLLAVSAYIATGTVDVLHRANRSVLASVRATTVAAEVRLRAVRRAYERERWNGLVHDKVLGALRIAAASPAGGVPAAARELAAQALAAFQGDPLSAGTSVAQQLREHAGLVGLDVDLRITEDGPDGDVREAFVEAAREALTNVRRHSGAAVATVVGRLDATRAELTVADDGRGFDALARPPRAGLTSSVTGRVRAVGGDAVVTSVPGRGTVVRLEWSAEQPAAPSDWQLRAFAPLMIVGAMSVFLNVAIGSQRWLHGHAPVLAGFGIVVIVALTAATTLSDPSGTAWRPVLVAMVLVCLLEAALVPRDAPSDWRYWFLGALTPAVGAIAFRYRPWAGVATAAAMVATVAGVDALAGRAPWSSLGGPVPVLVGTALAGHLIRGSMNDAWQRVAAQDAERARLRLASAVEEERSRETAARVTALAKTVGPDLQLVASGAGLTAEDRARMAILEGTARDHLGAPDLLDARLVLALSASRRRGVRVDVVPGGPGADVGRSLPVLSTSHRVQDAVAAYRRVLAVLLDEAPPRARVRAVWRQTADAVRGTVTVVTADADRLAARVAGLADELPVRPRVSGDEDAVLVEVASSSPGWGP